MGAPYRPTWSPKTIGSPREACGTAPSPRAVGQRTLRLLTSSASRTDSLPSTGRQSTGSGSISPSGSSLTRSRMAELERIRRPSVLRSGRVQLGGRRVADRLGQGGLADPRLAVPRHPVEPLALALSADDLHRRR